MITDGDLLVFGVLLVMGFIITGYSAFLAYLATRIVGEDDVYREASRPSQSVTLSPWQKAA